MIIDFMPEFIDFLVHDEIRFFFHNLKQFVHIRLMEGADGNYREPLIFYQIVIDWRLQQVNLVPNFNLP